MLLPDATSCTAAKWSAFMRLLYVCRARVSLYKKVPVRTIRYTVDFSSHLETKLSVEAWSLERKGVYLCRQTTPFYRFTFRTGHQVTAQTLASVAIIDPQDFN